jgi:hypothetical protein
LNIPDRATALQQMGYDNRTTACTLLRAMLHTAQKHKVTVKFIPVAIFFAVLPVLAHPSMKQ